MKGQGGGGTARGGGKTRSVGCDVKVVKTVARKTKAIEENVIRLRQAIFADNGKDKDVTQGIAPSFMKYNRNGLDCDIALKFKLSESELEWAFDLVKSTMEEKYDRSGYGWDDEDKEGELTEQGTRFLIVTERGWDTPIAFVHFRFTVQGEIIDEMIGGASLHVWDIHVQEEHQRKGLGKHLLTILELIARREKMDVVSIPIQLCDETSKAWINSKAAKGYAPDTKLRDLVGFDADVEGFEVYAKYLPTAVQVKAASDPTPVASAADKLAAITFTLNDKENDIAALPPPPAAAIKSSKDDVPVPVPGTDDDWVVVTAPLDQVEQ